MTDRPFQPRREDVRTEELAAYDRVVMRQVSYGYDRPAGEEAGPYYGAMLQAPVVADHVSELGAYFRMRGEVPGSFSHAQREWADMVVGKELFPTILWGHMLDAVASGVRPEAIKALVDERDEDLEPEELQLAEHIRQVIHGRVTAESYDAVEWLLGVRGAVEYTAWAAYLLLTVRLLGAYSPGGWSEIEGLVDERLASILDGTAELPEGPRVPAGEA
jgi:hypothetical protein